MTTAPAQAIEYIPGKQSIEGAVAIRLAANENPLPPLPSVVSAMAAGLDEVNRYPEPRADTLRAALATHLGVTADMISVGPGAGPVTERAIIAACGPDRDLLCAGLTFQSYPNHAAMAHAALVRVPLDAGLGHDLEAMAAAIGPRTGAVIVCNPNNPTATGVGFDRIAAFLAAVPETCTVILDEAYIDFGDDTCRTSIPLVAQYPNLLVARTFSKAFGLAGLRVGYVVAQRETIRQFDSARTIFQINDIGDRAARASLAAKTELEERVAYIRAERDRLSAEVAGLGLAVTPSQANFIYLPMALPAAQALTDYLESKTILVRQLGDGVRITVGTRAENDLLLDALRTR